ncbi:hypothetical protein KSP39_PZI012730 [Platanthera zijinensis]|uniref:Uncharacterized protein n=1 Tax=Platanthera zijinensis TaxID=2320716 RepID=A0AAP0BF40_9ASPA
MWASWSSCSRLSCEVRPNSRSASASRFWSSGEGQSCDERHLSGQDARIYRWKTAVIFELSTNHVITSLLAAVLANSEESSHHSSKALVSGLRMKSSSRKLVMRPGKPAFLLGQYYIKLTMKEVVVILGLSNRRLDYNFRRLPLSSVKQTELVNHLNEVTNLEDDSDEVEKQRVDALVLPKETASLGYLEGCSIILVVPMIEMAQPRLCRWASKGGFSYKFCEDLPRFCFRTKR